jgi:hypothetical protein
MNKKIIKLIKQGLKSINVDINTKEGKQIYKQTKENYKNTSSIDKKKIAKSLIKKA